MSRAQHLFVRREKKKERKRAAVLLIQTVMLVVKVYDASYWTSAIKAGFLRKH